MRTSKKCHKRQSHSIPGYAGYRPQIAQNTHLGRTITEQSRAVFHEAVLDKQKNVFSTTGFNAALIPQHDATREARSRRFGTETWHFPNPAHHPADYHNTTTRTSFYKPGVHAHPNLRDRDPGMIFDNSKNLHFTQDVNQHGNPARTTLEDTHFEKQALKELCSGYTMNR